MRKSLFLEDANLPKRSGEGNPGPIDRLSMSCENRHIQTALRNFLRFEYCRKSNKIKNLEVEIPNCILREEKNVK